MKMDTLENDPTALSPFYGTHQKGEFI
ncbi:hypothetical protein TIFTF001_039534 [Ficus carica]|uniref:Uncharacterized protein n=1 Tax=Ficus carica TaxID=3494 RepID=A0AA88JF72_FICCA|nr:hypothetical protein TIFTF001_039534 [Ficus carica]